MASCQHTPSSSTRVRTWDPDEECEKAVYKEVLVAADFHPHSQGWQEHGHNEPAQRCCCAAVSRAILPAPAPVAAALWWLRTHLQMSLHVRAICLADVRLLVDGAGWVLVPWVCKESKCRREWKSERVSWLLRVNASVLPSLCLPTKDV